LGILSIKASCLIFWPAGWLQFADWCLQITYTEFVSQEWWKRMTRGLNRDERVLLKAPLVYQEVWSLSNLWSLLGWSNIHHSIVDMSSHHLIISKYGQAQWCNL
jgi:hypothetical protein